MKPENDQPGEFNGPAEVRLVRTLPGPIERVWDYLTDPEKRARWFAGGPMEVRPGGKVTFLVRHKNLAPDETPPEEHRASHDAERSMSGTVTCCEPPRLLAFTFDHYGESEATFELTPQGKDVQLVVTHRGAGGDLSYMAGFGAGWHTHLAHLIALLEGAPRPPFWALHAQLKDKYDKRYAAAKNLPPRPQRPFEIMKTNEQPGKFNGPAEVRLVRTLPGPIERVWDYLTDPEKRARWFAGGPMEPKQGGKVELFFQHKNIAPDETPPEKMKHVQDPGFKMPATVLRWEPPRVLSYTFDDDSDVTFELTPQGKDVLLVLTHRARGEDLPFIAGYASGWHAHLAHLVALLEGAPRPPFWPLHTKLKDEYEKLHAAVK